MITPIENSHLRKLGHNLLICVQIDQKALLIQTLLVPDRKNGAFFIFQVHKALFSTPGAKRRYLRFFNKKK